MTPIIALARRAGHWVRGLVDSVRHGEDDMRTIYGEHPNGARTAEQTTLDASIAHNIGNLGNGGLG